MNAIFGGYFDSNIFCWISCIGWAEQGLKVIRARQKAFPGIEMLPFKSKCGSIALRYSIL